MLPNLSFPVLFFAQPILLKVVNVGTTNFEKEVTVIDSRTILATVQPADKRKLNIEQLDYALTYLEVHSLDNMEVNNYIEYHNVNYRIIAKGPYNDYAYNNVIAEESKVILK